MAKTMALVFGIIFILAGLLGFANNPLDGATGLFTTNGLDNIMYIVFGAVLLIASQRGPARSALWLKVFGIIFLVLALLGFLFSPTGPMVLGLWANNAPDNWLNVILGVLLLSCGIRGNSPASQSAEPMV